MVDIKIVREWIEKAEEDFQFALANLQERNSFFAQICFHFQQSAEKYLKAYIIAYDLEFRKAHDLPMLIKVCQAKDPSFGQLNEACEYLTTFYIETRYPVHWPTHFSREETEKAHQFAERIRSFAKQKLIME